MAALTLTHFFCFGFLCVLVFVSAEQKTITAESGQSITLPCRAPNNNIVVVEWSRALNKEYVFVYRDGQFDPVNQHPSFKNRVDLQDRQMKDGDVSVILKNVTVNDEGTYECRVFTGETRSWKSINTITLRVVAPPPGPGGTTEDGGKEAGGKEAGGKEDGGKEDGGKEDGESIGLIVGLSVSAVLLVAAVVFWMYKKHKVDESGLL